MATAGIWRWMATEQKFPGAASWPIGKALPDTANILPMIKFRHDDICLFRRLVLDWGLSKYVRVCSNFVTNSIFGGCNGNTWKFISIRVWVCTMLINICLMIESCFRIILIDKDPSHVLCLLIIIRMIINITNNYLMLKNWCEYYVLSLPFMFETFHLVN